MRLAVILIGLALVVGLLAYRFPYALNSDEDTSSLIYSVLLLVAVSASLFARRDISLKQHGKYALGWLGIILILMVGYSFRHELTQSRFFGELMPSTARLNEHGEIVLYADEQGHFRMEVKINGARTLFLVDTGATGISLSHDDAARAGIDTTRLTYNIPHSTANGTSFSASGTIDQLEIAGIVFENIPVSISKPGRLDTSLLGMRFLEQLKSYRVENGKLTLVP